MTEKRTKIVPNVYQIEKKGEEKPHLCSKCQCAKGYPLCKIYDEEMADDVYCPNCINTTDENKIHRYVKPDGTCEKGTDYRWFTKQYDWLRGQNTRHHRCAQCKCEYFNQCKTKDQQGKEIPCPSCMMTLDETKKLDAERETPYHRYITPTGKPSRLFITPTGKPKESKYYLSDNSNGELEDTIYEDSQKQKKRDFLTFQIVENLENALKKVRIKEPEAGVVKKFIQMIAQL